MKKSILLIITLFTVFAVSAQGTDSLTILANKGVVTAQFKLAMRYLEQDDFKQAVHWMERSANNGHAEAQNNMGVYYENGMVDGQRNFDKAFQFYTTSAEQGFVVAIYNLGLCYFNGRGTTAEKWTI